MHYTYLLRSKKDDKYYIGSSDDLKRRFLEHCNGQVNSTKHRRPLDLVYYEAYSSKELAIKREFNLKKHGSAYYGLLKRIDKK
jgi:putative endonuclease